MIRKNKISYQQLPPRAVSRYGGRYTKAGSRHGFTEFFYQLPRFK